MTALVNHNNNIGYDSSLNDGGLPVGRLKIKVNYILNRYPFNIFTMLLSNVSKANESKVLFTVSSVALARKPFWITLFIFLGFRQDVDLMTRLYLFKPSYVNKGPLKCQT